MITRREMNTSLGVALTAFFSGGASALLHAETSPSRQDSQDHMSNMSASGVKTLMQENLSGITDPEVTVITLTVAPGDGFASARTHRSGLCLHSRRSDRESSRSGPAENLQRGRLLLRASDARPPDPSEPEQNRGSETPHFRGRREGQAIHHRREVMASGRLVADVCGC